MSPSPSQTLLQKYTAFGPHYTSYPTAVHFDDRFTEQDYRWHVEHSNQDPLPKPLSVYLHIPFCQTLCYYCDCRRVVTSSWSKIQRYLVNLNREIQIQGGMFVRDREVRQVQFGGGTPTYVRPEDVRQLLANLQASFSFDWADVREVSIQIDPRTSDRQKIGELVRMGFNRMIFGVADFNPLVQVAVNRVQDKNHTLALLQEAREAGIESVSVELVCGLPRQTLESFTETLDDVLQVRPDRIAIFDYTHTPALIKSQRLIAQEDLPTADEKLAALSYCVDTLVGAGYCQIGVDHFALPDDALSQSLDSGCLQRNLQGYSPHGACDMVGLGVSAIGKVGDAYSQNCKSLSAYEQSLASGAIPIMRGRKLDMDDKIRSAVIQGIMCEGRVNFIAIEQSFHILFRQYFGHELRELAAFSDHGLVQLSRNDMQVTDRGRLFLRNIAMVFDAFFTRGRASVIGPRFSEVS